MKCSNSIVFSDEIATRHQEPIWRMGQPSGANNQWRKDIGKISAGDEPVALVIRRKTKMTSGAGQFPDPPYLAQAAPAPILGQESGKMSPGMWTRDVTTRVTDPSGQ
jgi:hypothetical protein